MFPQSFLHMGEQKISYLIIGNGIAGVTAAEILRAEDPQASIAIIADDPCPVYYRPALKDYLGGHIPTDKLWARPTSFYQDTNIVFLPDHVIGLQSDRHAVLLQSRKQIIYQKLLLANGASPARLNCPGNELHGVTTLRTITDYQQVLERLDTARSVVISGSGTLALETAESLRQRGLEVTHLLRSTMLWSEILDTTASDLVLQEERRAGVEVCLEEEIVEITGTRGKVSGAITNRGRRIACQMVIVAIGIEPNIKPWLTGGVSCARGVQVDDTLRTNLPDIYAAGDLIETRDTLTNHTRVIGQWYPAIQQARIAAYSMLGRSEEMQPFGAYTFYNATFLYGLDFASAGLTLMPRQPGYQELVADPQPRSYRKVILRNNIPVGVLALGDRKQALALKRAIDHRVNVLSVISRLFNPNFNLHAWLNQQGVPPPLLAVGSNLAQPSQQIEKNTSVTFGSDKTITQKASVPRVEARFIAPPLGMEDVRRELDLFQTGEEKTQLQYPQTDRRNEKDFDLLPIFSDRDNSSQTTSKMSNDSALGGGEEIMVDTQNLAAADYEALLVHIVDPSLRLYVPETPLSKDKILRIGRQAGVHLLLDEPSISRQHAEISYAAGHYLLQDQGSTNGTFVNEQRLDTSRPYVLQANDILRFGNIVRLKFLVRVLSYRSRIQAPAYQDESAKSNYNSAYTTALVNDSREADIFQEQYTTGQAVLNPDGTLSTPGISEPVPAPIVAQLQKAPALVILPSGPAQNGLAPEVYFLNPGKRTTIGREKDNDIVLTDLTVSRHHAEVFLNTNGFYIRDLKSSYGIYINQTKIQDSYPLSHSDRIKLGSTRIFFIDLQAGSERTRNSINIPGLSSAPPAPVQNERLRSATNNKKGPTERRAMQQNIPRQTNVTICPRCGVANIRAARFCASCSAML
jgi:NADPH-dependent 2,4-dienoyl-CoA reductase/sulfur reductase-like enzyme/pSer/pThr/pTyr-binding forkhead associated (FHA) protein